MSTSAAVSDRIKRSGRELFRGIAFESLKPTVEKMLRGYLRHRQKGENFQAFTRRHDLNTLQAILSNEE